MKYTWGAMHSPTLFITEDGSPTLVHPITGESYHSIHGALRESRHVYLHAGTLSYLDNGYDMEGNLGAPAPQKHSCSAEPSKKVEKLRILEVGFGSGLNAVLTILALANQNQAFSYDALEPFPISMPCAQDYMRGCGDLFESTHHQDLFMRLHAAKMGEPTQVEHESLDHVFCKHLCDLGHFETNHPFEVIYMDAFSPSSQPELWEPPILQKLARMLSPGGYLVTYCAKGSVRRGLLAAGLEIERLPGPPGKREMLRARKPLLLFEGL